MPTLDGQWVSNAAWFTVMNKRYPHQVDVRHYKRRLLEGSAPRPSEVEGCVSWLKRRTKTGGTRTFAFRTAREASDFKRSVGEEAES